MEKVAEQKFGTRYDIYFNEDSSYVLVKNQIKKRRNEPFLSYDFFIYDFVNDKIIYDKPIGRGDAKWISNSKLEISTIPGRLRDGETMEDYVFIYDVNKREKQKK